MKAMSRHEDPTRQVEAGQTSAQSDGRALQCRLVVTDDCCNGIANGVDTTSVAAVDVLPIRTLSAFESETVCINIGKFV